jgi:hypothetical protein
MNRAVRWQALALVAGLTVSLEAGAAAAPPKAEKAPKAAPPPKPQKTEAPKPQKAEAPKAAALSGGAFGQAGQLVIGSDLSLLFGYTTAGDYGAFRLMPAADYFFMDNLSASSSSTTPTCRRARCSAPRASTSRWTSTRPSSST